MNRVSKSALTFAVPKQGYISFEECCYPTCSAPCSEKIQEPFCDRHMIQIFRLVTDLGKQFDQKPVKSIKQVKPVKKGISSEVPGLVYFIRFGDRIKIGFSRRILNRLNDLPHEEVLLLIPGTFKTEGALHNEFSHLRVSGEWFQAHPDLFARIEELKEQHTEYRIS